MSSLELNSPTGSVLSLGATAGPGWQRNWRVRNREVGLAARTRMCVREGSAGEWPTSEQERRTEWERKAESWVQSRKANSQALRNQEAAAVFGC